MSDFTEINRTHWNKQAATYNSRHEKTLTQLAAEISARLDFIDAPFLDSDSEDEEDDEIADADERANNPDAIDSHTHRRSFKMLDYACGTGMVSRALGSYASQTIGIDVSENMLSEYNTRASNQGLKKKEMYAYLGNLLDPADSQPAALAGDDFWNFDLAVVGLGWHHFEDTELAATRLAERLKPGGVLLIIDFLPHADFSGHGHGHASGSGSGSGSLHHHHTHKVDPVKDDEVVNTVKHLGFSEEEVKTTFQQAGVGGAFAYEVMGKGIVFKRDEGNLERHVFIARGTKI